MPDQLGLDGYAIYCKTIPYMLYAFVGIVLSLLVALKVVPLTRTIKGQDEAAALTEPSGEKEDHGSGKEARAFYFYLPLLVVIAVTILLGGDLIAGIFLLPWCFGLCRGRNYAQPCSMAQKRSFPLPSCC